MSIIKEIYVKEWKKWKNEYIIYLSRNDTK